MSYFKRSRKSIKLSLFGTVIGMAIGLLLMFTSVINYGIHGIPIPTIGGLGLGIFIASPIASFLFPW